MGSLLTMRVWAGAIYRPKRLTSLSRADVAWGLMVDRSAYPTVLSLRQLSVFNIFQYPPGLKNQDLNRAAQ